MQFIHLLILDMPAALRRDARLFWLVALVFVACILFGYGYVHVSLDAVHFVYDDEQLIEFKRMYDPEWQAMTMQDQSSLEMFLFYVGNNGWMALQLFLLGALFGFGTLFLLAYNGICLGLMMGYLSVSGYSATLWPSILAHSSFETIATLVAATAGLKWGFSLILLASPLKRAQFVKRFAQSAFLLLNALVLFVLAALVEAFWSANYTIPVEYKYLSGLFFWIVLPGLIAYYGHVAARK
jgi:uncharacterized membrane protein SpoIIM required for sporulation